MNQITRDLIFESATSLVLASILAGFLCVRGSRGLRNIPGWKLILIGLALLLFGSLVDITDEFPQLNFLIILGNTPAQAFVEKMIGNMLGYLTLAIGIWMWIPQVISNQKRVQEDLQETKHQISELKGLLPICSSCKNIRNDKGYWEELEEYVRKHTEADFSHGLCPDCIKRLYPEEYEKMQAKRKSSLP